VEAFNSSPWCCHMYEYRYSQLLLSTTALHYATIITLTDMSSPFPVRRSTREREAEAEQNREGKKRRAPPEVADAMMPGQRQEHETPSTSRLSPSSSSPSPTLPPSSSLRFPLFLHQPRRDYVNLPPVRQHSSHHLLQVVTGMGSVSVLTGVVLV
jgi:hypothetical protein